MKWRMQLEAYIPSDLSLSKGEELAQIIYARYLAAIQWLIEKTLAIDDSKPKNAA